jgi:hypothetical protein
MTKENLFKPVPITQELLDSVEMAMVDNSFEVEWYLDLKEKQATFISDVYDDPDDESITALRQEIENGSDDGRFIPIPAWSSDEEWLQMETFIVDHLDDKPEEMRHHILDAIRGRGAFSRFKNMMYENGLDQRWFDFKNQEDRRRALEWLRSMDLISDSDVETGLQLHDERVQYRKQRKLDIKNMQAGAQVRCIDDHGHIDKLTIGKDYKILDEQPEHRNIYIQDDRGKTVWMPKSHFEIKEIENKINPSRV